jgi:2-oxoglutarate ferredoxin oxidoreductase subunit alpha
LSTPSGSEPYDLSIAVTGSGGSGAVTTGLILLQAAAQAGLYGLMTRSAGPQIRGGESAALLRLTDVPVGAMGDRFDLLVALDWLNLTRFLDEIPLDSNSLLLADPAAGAVPQALRQTGARSRELPFRQLAAGVEGGRPNMVALGALGGLIGLSETELTAGLERVLANKGRATRDASRRCIALGFGRAAGALAERRASPPAHGERWSISGNEACGLGALRGGVRFVAAYPITPASEVLEWLAPRLETLGGSLLQAEDELASINMIIGASFGGVPALTATSGPGLSLMTEGLGLAIASETPVTVIDVMRGGPSTGIPTKSEQADLNLALYGLHGDAPHLVLAPLDIGDCAFTSHWAVRLAEHLQTAAIVLSDQSLGQSRAIVDRPEPFEFALARPVEESPDSDYQRYRLTDDGVSPMSVPGAAGGMYTADGLEHDVRGTPSSAAADHRTQLDKRRAKLAEPDYGPHWAEVDGDGPLCLLTWGSSAGAVREAARRLRASGWAVRTIALRLLQPLQRNALWEALRDVRRVWVIEQNHSGQLFHYLRSEDALPAEACSLARPGPLPLRPGELVEAVTSATADNEEFSP